MAAVRLPGLPFVAIVMPHPVHGPFLVTHFNARPASICATNSHNRGSSKSFTTSFAPAASRRSGVCVVAIPTVKIPASLAAFTPGNESSNANACLASAPSCCSPVRYGSGSGLGRASSSATSTCSKRAPRPIAASICSALSRGALVTTHMPIPRSSACSSRRNKPGMGSSAGASSRNSASLRSASARHSAVLACGNNSANNGPLARPLTWASNCAWVSSRPSCSRSNWRKACKCRVSVSVRVPSRSNSKAVSIRYPGIEKT